MQLLVIKKEKEDLEKLVNKNKLIEIIFRNLKNYSLIFFLMFSFCVSSQENSFTKGDEYILDEISL